MKRHAVVAWLVAALVTAAGSAPGAGEQRSGGAPVSSGGQQVVFLVRHAERADEGMAAAKAPGADPELSQAGRSRANALAAMLKDAKITSIFVTEYKRTRDTAQPLAQAIGLATVTINAKDSRLLQTVTAATGNVLVVGHSNTLPEVIKALGITEPISIAEEEYDNLFVVIRGEKPSLLRLHYR